MSFQDTLQKIGGVVKKVVEQGQRKALHDAFEDPDPAKRKANGELLRARLGQHEHKLRPETWATLLRELDHAVATGEVAALEAAVDAADGEIKAARQAPGGGAPPG